jgi:hypothetical protein
MIVATGRLGRNPDFQATFPIQEDVREIIVNSDISDQIQRRILHIIQVLIRWSANSRLATRNGLRHFDRDAIL